MFTGGTKHTLILNFQQVKRPNQERKDVKGKKGGVKAKPGLRTGGQVAEICSWTLGSFLVGGSNLSWMFLTKSCHVQ